MNLQEMIARQRELTEAARQQGRSLTAEEQREFDSLQEQIDSMTASGQEGQRGANPPAGNSPASGEAAPGGDEARAAAMAERQRVRGITDLCQRFGMDSEPYISNDSTLDQVRAAVIEHLQRTKGPVGTRVTEDEGDKKRNAMTDGILLRQGIHVENPAPGANDFRNATLQMIAANCLSQEDSQRNYYMESGDEVYSALLQRAYYNPSSAFPAIMDNVIRKSYVEGHKTAPVTFEHFTTRGTLTDFKKADNYYVQGGFGRFLEVPENGELKHTLPTDEKKPQRQLKTYGRQFTMSRQAFINDDMGVITTLPNRAAKAARMTINSQVYQILTGNPKIYDGKTLFVSDHKNLLREGTGITQEAVQAMILALGGHKKKQDDIEEAIIIRPGTIVVPLGYQFAMYTLFNSPTISASGAVNPLFNYKDTIQIVEDATLNVQIKEGSPIPWFMVGDKNDTDFIQVDYLNGQDIPNIRRMEAPGQLGFVWDVYLDWGIAVMDYRGAVKNPGIALESPIGLA